ncbi:AcrR family transcriptional regulator [Gillisia sp. Hel_I_86]|uniref:TetR family transcriptional regulator C-terminal domain-containing protein n=1 Tax=Gillisia sp. Hel_I_86 TaxID=1249981 RepID=UPI00119B1C46|nr:TetR family transcriptional regulator C-terminal domain-containing protein [Gillisia sp. Hel_I_86]TVZ25434.1 AcrR family transcriptional regulator [Gillisia sp. Hel_I_86]
MATKKQPAEKKFSKELLIGLYMNYVLEHEQMPKSVYKFAKEHKITEAQFYEYFGSFDGLRKGIWNQFYVNTMDVMQKSIEFEAFTPREKLLTFYYTFFELLTANRSYVLLTLNENPNKLKNLEQLKELRKDIKGFAKELISEGNESKNAQFLKQSETIFSEATWVQFLFILKFWLEDNSAKFESTDVVIEKSVNTVFDLFDNTPLERVIDLGKFLWKEKMN